MKYIALLRGINVSGQKKIKMKELQVLCENLGFFNVVTYIQSGNVIFDSKEKTTKKAIEDKVKKAIETRFGFDVPVQIIKKTEWQKVLDQYPFTDINAEENGSQVLVTFLSEKPATKAVNQLNEYIASPERLHLNNQVIYLYCPNGYGKTKLSNTFIEKKLGVSATTRNWKTVQKLLALSNLS